MNDISASGLSIQILADKTFPNGFTFNEFADDADPFDLPSLEIAATAMNLNGSLVTWTAPQPIVPTINAIPGSDGERNLAILFEANRSASGKTVARDVITMVATYSDGSTVTLSSGKLTAGFPGKSVASAGRMKSKAYTFAFETISITNA